MRSASSKRGFSFLAVAVAIALTCARSADAQQTQPPQPATPTPTAPTSTANEQVAQTLFEAARQHLAKGEVERACAELEKSFELDPAGGTLLNLAFCHERLGKTATAWNDYGRALEQAKRDHRADRQKTAETKLAALAPRLAKWTLIAPLADAVALSIEIDGAPFERASLGIEVPCDPGAHVIRATAKDKRPREINVTMKEGDHTRIEIPTLEDDPAKTPVPAATTPVSSPTPTSQPDGAAIAPAPADSVTPPPRPRAPLQQQEGGYGTVHYVLFATGGAALVASAVFGVLAIEDKSKVSDSCIASRSFCKDQSGIGAADEMRTYAWTSTITLAGGAMAGIAALAWPRTHASTTAYFDGQTFGIRGSL